jgi:hypothetical protein
MKCAVEMDSGVMIYIPSFIKIGSGIQNLIREINRHNSMEISKAFYFFKIRKYAKKALYGIKALKLRNFGLL